MSRFDAGAGVPADGTKRSAGVTCHNHPPRDPVRDERCEPRGLVVVNPKQMQAKAKPSRYADALFLAHMFASKFDAPQQREKRRADPADVNASYRKSARQPVRPGRVLSKKV